MFEWLFGRKKDLEEIERVKEETKRGFEAVKQDIGKSGEWIVHLNSQQERQKDDISELKDELSTIKTELLEVKDFINFWNSKANKHLFKQRQTAVYKQTPVQGVQTPVQTAVQSAFLSNLSVNERHIIWTLLNTEMMLSYEDLAVMLGKDKTTIRGQINTIRQKSEGLIEESVEKNGKKRVFIPEEIKDKLLKSSKIKERRKNRKSEDFES